MPPGKLIYSKSSDYSMVCLTLQFPDNTFQVFVDGSLANSGNLLENMTPPVNPPIEIPDENDKKPADWDERENIVDPNAKKPEDWDESAPAMIPDPKAEKPIGWLDDEEVKLKQVCQQTAKLLPNYMNYDVLFWF